MTTDSKALSCIEDDYFHASTPEGSTFVLYLRFPTTSCPKSPLFSWNMIGGSSLMASLLRCGISALKYQNYTSTNQEENMYCW
jgi:hypothetical protein